MVMYIFVLSFSLSHLYINVDGFLSSKEALSTRIMYVKRKLEERLRVNWGPVTVFHPSVAASRFTAEIMKFPVILAILS